MMPQNLILNIYYLLEMSKNTNLQQTTKTICLALGPIKVETTRDTHLKSFLDNSATDSFSSQFTF